MTTIGRALSRAIVTLNDNEILKQLALLCAAGLFVSLLMLTYGRRSKPGLLLAASRSLSQRLGRHERSSDST